MDGLAGHEGVLQTHIETLPRPAYGVCEVGARCAQPYFV